MSDLKRRRGEGEKKITVTRFHRKASGGKKEMEEEKKWEKEGVGRGGNKRKRGGENMEEGQHG